WDKFFMTSSSPARNTRYKLLAEEGFDFDYRYRQGDVKPKTEQKENFTLYSWEKDKSESLKEESYMPPMVDLAEVIHLSSIPDWDYIAKWYYDLSESKIDANYVVENKLKDLFPEGHEDMTDEEKVKIIYEYIVKDIRYSSVSFRQSNFIPQKASKTILTKIGDCKDVSTLFVTLAREVGLDAHITLVNTRGNGKKDMVLPSPAFNHAIAAVFMDGKKYYTDLTSDKLPFSTFGQGLKNSFSLDIIGDEEKTITPDYLNPDTREENNIYRYSTIRFEDGSMNVSKRTIKTGTYASYMRNSYQDEGDETIRKKMAEAISSDIKNVTLKTLKFDESLDNTSDTVTYEYSFMVDNAFTNVGSMSLLKLPFADPEESNTFTSSIKRDFPVELWKFTSRDNYYEKLNIKLPSDKRIVEKPEDKHFDSEFASYDLTFELNGDELIVNRKFSLKKPHVPQEKYEEFTSFYKKVVAADGTQIGVK
ncbi:MAG: transglutaminase-like domain-containing protein, partial [Bacteroidales bacterium]|nr:transglutaminase-like domain-containing protein [Bacteroidales bacterium]